MTSIDDILSDQVQKEIMDILQSSSDWQEALKSIEQSDIHLSEEQIDTIVGKHFIGDQNESTNR